MRGRRILLAIFCRGSGNLNQVVGGGYNMIFPQGHIAQVRLDVFVLDGDLFYGCLGFFYALTFVFGLQ